MANAVLLADYYAILNLPTDADITGIQNAYARLSGELAQLGEIDSASSEALRKLNEAYGVLGRGDLRAQYDAVFLAAERVRAQAAATSVLRRRRMMQNAIIAALGLVV